MNWVRSRVRLGSWLALFALAIQLALLFGHLHLSATHPRSFVSARASRCAVGPGIATVRVSSPAQQNPERLTVPACDICAVAQLAGSVVPPAAPSLPLPTTRVRVSLNIGIEVAAGVSPQLSFEARAPPGV
jgi:hypothetical protein